MAGRYIGGFALDRALRSAVRSVYDGIAVDRAPENRTKTVDGRLVVKVNNISKACVSPYLGEEIPDWESLGLDPQRIYQLYRHPGELKKAASTFNSIPILLVHKPSTADDHPRELTVGTTGNDAEFNAPYLQNSLVIWDGEGVEAVESKKQHELSPGYRFTARMTSGTTPDGEYYDGIMTALSGNHLCLVELGRTGHDVVVGDSQNASILWNALEQAIVEREMVQRNGGVTQVALDSALRIAVREARESTVRQIQDAQTARDKVASFMDASEMAMDGTTTARQIYGRFLDRHGVDHAGFNDKAYQVLTDIVIKDLRSGRQRPACATDTDIRAFEAKHGIPRSNIRHL
jgi:hypothetical protein